MSDIAIKVENISKRYRIGLKEKLNDTLTGTITSWIKSPVSNFRKLRKLSTFKDNEDSDDIVWAIKDVSFDVKHGEIIGVIGRNGAGKSTLLKVLSRIIEPSHGRAEINGRLASLIEVGVGFHPELTGRENIYLNGCLLGMNRREINMKLEEILTFAEIDKFVDTPVKKYSTGMKVRLAFAVAAHLEPEILLVDEVLAVGDAEFQKKCIGKMEEVSQAGRTVLFVSHNMLAVNSLCSKGIVLDKGKVIYIGDIELAIKKYMSRNMDHSGEITWDREGAAPGNHQVRLNAIRIVSDGKVTGSPSIDKDIEIQVDYWNLEEDAKRVISFHVVNEMGITIFTSSNFDGATLTPDEWYNKKYPYGLFRTRCIIPSFLLNDGVYNVHLFITKWLTGGVLIKQKDLISFNVEDSIEMRKGLHSKWIGAVRPKLAWSTERIG